MHFNLLCTHSSETGDVTCTSNDTWVNSNSSKASYLCVRLCLPFQLPLILSLCHGFVGKRQAMYNEVVADHRKQCMYLPFSRQNYVAFFAWFRQSFSKFLTFFPSLGHFPGHGIPTVYVPVAVSAKLRTALLEIRSGLRRAFSRRSKTPTALDRFLLFGPLCDNHKAIVKVEPLRKGSLCGDKYQMALAYGPGTPRLGLGSHHLSPKASC